MRVLAIPTDAARPWIMERHYARRMPPVSFAYGAFDGAELVGVVTYGVPASSPLRAGLCGGGYADRVLELNRLVCETTANLASRLVGQSLRLLPRPSIIVSFADIGQGHIGYVYQATNFIYTGLSAKRTDWRLTGSKSHSQSIVDLSRGHENRADWMREQFGDDFYLEERSRKHRYVAFTGTKRERREMLAALRYPIEPYPKGDTQRYEAPDCARQAVML